MRFIVLSFSLFESESWPRKDKLSWWIFTQLYFRGGESWPNYFGKEVNLVNLHPTLFSRWWILTQLFWKRIILVNLHPTLFSRWWILTQLFWKRGELGESSPNFIFAVVNLDPIILEKRWIDGESWPNDLVEKVNRGEHLRWVGSRCPLTRALIELIVFT